MPSPLDDISFGNRRGGGFQDRVAKFWLSHYQLGNVEKHLRQIHRETTNSAGYLTMSAVNTLLNDFPVFLACQRVLDLSELKAWDFIGVADWKRTKLHHRFLDVLDLIPGGWEGPHGLVFEKVQTDHRQKAKGSLWLVHNHASLKHTDCWRLYRENELITIQPFQQFLTQLDWRPPEGGIL